MTSPGDCPFDAAQGPLMNTLAPNSLSDSWLETLVKWLRSRKMSDWIKIIVAIAGVAIVTWAAVQQHDYRIGQLESSFKEHLDKHDDQYREIQKALRDIDMTLTRLNAANGR